MTVFAWTALTAGRIDGSHLRRESLLAGIPASVLRPVSISMVLVLSADLCGFSHGVGSILLEDPLNDKCLAVARRLLRHPKVVSDAAGGEQLQPSEEGQRRQQKIAIGDALNKGKRQHASTAKHGE